MIIILSLQHYIVYMGSSRNDHKGEEGARLAESAHWHLLSSIIPRLFWQFYNLYDFMGLGQAYV